MQCDRCEAANPDPAQFCWRCGRGLRQQAGDPGRGQSYAVQPSEAVAQLALISTLLPHLNRRVANDYRWALTIGAGAALVLAVVGLLAPAIMIAAFLLPVTYLVYVHDVDLWEERPGALLIALYVVAAAGAAVVSLVFFRWIGSDGFAALLFVNAGRAGVAGLPLGDLALFGVALPLVGELARQIGPLWLAGRPQFDDMIDGFTFGVASGVAYSAFESFIAFGPIFTVGIHSTDSLATWLIVIVNLMIVKPVVYGCATGIAVAAYSGKGEGVDGFTGAYGAKLLLAIGANVAYWLGVRLLAAAPFGQALGLMWGVVIAGLLIVRVRLVLQTALLEAAVEDAARGHRPKHATTDLGYCPECENALLPDAAFCIVCGMSVRATSNAARRHIREPSPPPRGRSRPRGRAG